MERALTPLFIKRAIAASICLILGQANIYFLPSAFAGKDCSSFVRNKSAREWIEQRVDQFRSRQMIRRTSFSFHSGISGRRTHFTVDRKLGSSSADVYLSEDNRHIVKVYNWNRSGRHRVEIAEIFVTEYLIFKGLDVPRIVDYSDNILRPDGAAMYIVKEYKQGLNQAERQKLGIVPDGVIGYLLAEYRGGLSENQRTRLGITAYADLAKQQEKFRRALAGFPAWLTKHPNKAIFHEAFPHSSSIGDVNREDNWILGPKGWILIDL